MEGIIFDWVGTLYERNKGLFPYSERILRELKPQYRLGMVSLARDGIEARAAELSSSGLMGLFDSVVIDTSKTPKQYLRCMEELGVTPQETSIVDDRAVRGIQVGNLLGCRTFWIQIGEYAHEMPDSETGEPTHRIDSVEDLLRIL